MAGNSRGSRNTCWHSEERKCLPLSQKPRFRGARAEKVKSVSRCSDSRGRLRSDEIAVVVNDISAWTRGIEYDDHQILDAGRVVSLRTDANSVSPQ